MQANGFFLQTLSTLVASLVLLAIAAIAYYLTMWRPYAARLWEQRQRRYPGWLFTLNEYLACAQQLHNQWTKESQTELLNLDLKARLIHFEALAIGSHEMVELWKLLRSQAYLLWGTKPNIRDTQAEMDLIKASWDGFEELVKQVRRDLRTDKIDHSSELEVGISDLLVDCAKGRLPMDKEPPAPTAD